MTAMGGRGRNAVEVVLVEGREIAISNPGKVLFPSAGVYEARPRALLPGGRRRGAGRRWWPTHRARCGIPTGSPANSSIRSARRPHVPSGSRWCRFAFHREEARRKWCHATPRRSPGSRTWPASFFFSGPPRRVTGGPRSGAGRDVAATPLPAAPAGGGVRGWGRDGLGTGARGRGARARRAFVLPSLRSRRGRCPGWGFCCFLRRPSRVFARHSGRGCASSGMWKVRPSLRI